MERKKIKRKATISKELLQRVYDTKLNRDERFERLADAISDLTGGDFRCTVYDAEADNLIDRLMKALLGKTLYDGWDGLVTECRCLGGNGKIEVEGREYVISDVDSLWNYWESENLI